MARDAPRNRKISHIPIRVRTSASRRPGRNGPPAESRGAYHSAEIEFVFNVLHHKKLPWGPEDFKLADLMAAYWANFARTGDPNGPGLPHWPACIGEDGYQVMHLSAKPHSEPDSYRARYEFLDRHPSIK